MAGLILAGDVGGTKTHLGLFRRTGVAVEAVREPGMPLDKISRWTRQMPLQALAVAFLIGVMTVRRRRR